MKKDAAASLPQGDLCGIERPRDASPCRRPHLRASPGWGSIPGRPPYRAPASSLAPGPRRSGRRNWRGPLRGSILACVSLREKGPDRHRPLALILRIIPCSTAGAAKKQPACGARGHFYFSCTACFRLHLLANGSKGLDHVEK